MTHPGDKARDRLRRQLARRGPAERTERARVEYLGGSKFRYTYVICGHTRTQVLMTGPRGARTPICEDAAQFYARYWGGDIPGSGVSIPQCSTCKRRRSS